MIALTRKRTKSAINPKFHGEDPIERLVELMEKEKQIVNGTLKKHKFPSKWSSTKKQLQKESNGKCAYCESTTTESMHGDVEHYRPKSKYWWLAYVYDNYLASCQLCNQKFKSNNFTIASGGTRIQGPKITTSTTKAQMRAIAKKAIPDPLDLAAVAAYEDEHRKERPLIINAYIDDPTEFFAWRVREDIKEVDLVPVAGNPDAPAVVKAAEDFLGLNRAELRERRYSVYSKYRLFADLLDMSVLDDDTKERIEKQVEDFAAPSSSYAGMIRFFENER